MISSVFKVRDAHSIAKFNDFLKFNVNENEIMHSRLRRIKFRCNETFHSDIEKKGGWF